MGLPKVIKAKLPVNMDKMPQDHIDREILRVIMINKLDSINLLDQMCYNTVDKDVTKLLDGLLKSEWNDFEDAEDLLEKLEDAEDDD